MAEACQETELVLKMFLEERACYHITTEGIKFQLSEVLKAIKCLIILSVFKPKENEVREIM